MSTPVNIQNKGHVTFKLLIDVKLEMCVGGRLLGWEFTLRGTPACFSLLSEMSRWETLLGLLPGAPAIFGQQLPCPPECTPWLGHGSLAVWGVEVRQQLCT